MPVIRWQTRCLCMRCAPRTAHLANPALEGDAAARGELALAAVLCGQGTDFTGAASRPRSAIIIGSRHHVENGIVNAIMLTHALRFNAEFIQPGLMKSRNRLWSEPHGHLSLRV